MKTIMATSTFDKLFIVTDPKDQQRIWDVIYSDEPAAPINCPPYTEAMREQSVAALRECFARRDAATARSVV